MAASQVRGPSRSKALVLYALEARKVCRGQSNISVISPAPNDLISNSWAGKGEEQGGEAVELGMDAFCLKHRDGGNRTDALSEASTLFFS